MSSHSEDRAGEPGTGEPGIGELGTGEPGTGSRALGAGHWEPGPGFSFYCHILIPPPNPLLKRKSFKLIF